MKTTTIAFALLSIMAILNACQKTDRAIDAPCCIKQKIIKAMQEPVRNPPMSVWRYDFHEQKVYYIPAQCCDFGSELYDKDCHFICSPDGGFSGCGDLQCTDFLSDRKNPELIWEDNRR